MAIPNRLDSLTLTSSIKSQSVCSGTRAWQSVSASASAIGRANYTNNYKRRGSSSPMRLCVLWTSLWLHFTIYDITITEYQSAISVITGLRNYGYRYISATFRNYGIAENLT